jgi:hypothetical protein
MKNLFETQFFSIFNLVLIYDPRNLQPILINNYYQEYSSVIIR